MKYFTADEYDAFQDENNHGDEWEKNIEAYSKRLEEIKDKLPYSVKAFMETCHLHDADFDNFACFSLGYPNKAEFVIHQRNWGQQEFICILRYRLARPGYIAQVSGTYQDCIRQTVHKHKVFAATQQNPKNVASWLYDEWDYLGQGVSPPYGEQKEEHREDVFTHTFLLSSGIEFKFTFSEFEFIYIPVGEGFLAVPNRTWG